MPFGRSSVVNFDPIRQKRGEENSWISKLLVSRWYGGKAPNKTDPFGLYLICGKQRQGKTVHMVWRALMLKRKYEKAGKKVIIYSNLPLEGIEHEYLDFANFAKILYSLKAEGDEVRIVLCDEMQIYFPRDTKDKEKQARMGELLDVLCQLGKRRIYLLATSQVYGRVDKSMREQALYMVDVKRGMFSGKIRASYILGDDIVVDDLGRWSGRAHRILIHGLPKSASFNTRHIITSLPPRQAKAA